MYKNIKVVTYLKELIHTAVRGVKNTNLIKTDVKEYIKKDKPQ